MSSVGGFQGIRPTSYGPSFRTGSYSPSSPSPLAQQMTGRDSPASQTRGGAGGATASLRSIFQSYAPSSSSPTSQSSLSFSRTPPKSVSRGGSDFSPSPLGPEIQSSTTTARDSPASTPSDEIPPNINTQNPASSSSSLRKPTVAPQMIKRYSSTFSYRSGRQQAGSLGVENVEGGAGAMLLGSGSLESSENLPFSRSWAARLEQRQSFSSRSAGRDEGNSFTSRYARSRVSIQDSMSRIPSREVLMK